jgi:hypothetical protein
VRFADMEALGRNPARHGGGRGTTVRLHMSLG